MKKHYEKKKSHEGLKWSVQYDVGSHSGLRKMVVYSITLLVLEIRKS